MNPTISALGLSVLSHSALLAHTSNLTDRWTVEGFMERGCYAVLAGESKSGKTALATNLAYSVALGKPFLGKKTEQASVLWLAYEESERERAYLCGKYPDAPVFTLMHPAPIDSPEGIDHIRYCVEQLGVGLVVADPLMAAVKTDSMSEPRNARKALEGLGKLRCDLDVSVLLLHHNRKGRGVKGDPGKMADSHQIHSATSQAWVMEVDKRNGRKIRLFGSGRGEHANKDWCIQSDNEWHFELCESGSKTEKSADLASRILSVVQSHPEGIASSDIAKQASANARTVKNVVTRLKDQGLIVPVGKASRATLWISTV